MNTKSEDIKHKLESMGPQDRYNFIQMLSESKTLNESNTTFAKTKHIAGDGMQYLKSKGVVFPNNITEIIDNA